MLRVLTYRTIPLAPRAPARRAFCPARFCSAANSTAVHACINPAACGDGWDESEPWSKSVEATLAAADPDTLVWSQAQPALALAYAAVDIITSDPRSRLLGRCQQWW